MPSDDEGNTTSSLKFQLEEKDLLIAKLKERTQDFVKKLHDDHEAELIEKDKALEEKDVEIAVLREENEKLLGRLEKSVDGGTSSEVRILESTIKNLKFELGLHQGRKIEVEELTTSLDESNEKIFELQESITEISHKLAETQNKYSLALLQHEEEIRTLQNKLDANGESGKNGTCLSLDEAAERVEALEKELANKNKLMQDLVAVHCELG